MWELLIGISKFWENKGNYKGIYKIKNKEGCVHYGKKRE